MYKDVDFEELVGHKIISITGLTEGSEEVMFITDKGCFRQFHHQDCCENVSVKEVSGDINDLIGEVILYAEVSATPKECEWGGLEMWTFYKLATIKGYVDISWYGESNGYYSVDVSLDYKPNEAVNHAVN